MNGYGSHTFMWVNAAGERAWVKFQFKTDQGIATLTSDEAAAIGGRDPGFLQHDLYAAIERGEHPSWTLQVQIMPEAEATHYRFDPFDLTKVWPHADYPLIEIAKLVLDRTPDNYFAEVEQAAFDPGNMVPGIGPSPDRMLQARLFAYGDAHRYRLGINHTQLRVNAPQGVAGGARNYGRDGFMRFDQNGGASKNYEPNSYAGPVPTGEPYDFALALAGATGTQAHPVHRDNDDFVQAGALYRLMDEAARARLIDNLAGSLAQVSRPDVVERSVGYFARADVELGSRLRDAIAAVRAALEGDRR
jgi:catalase